MSSLVPTQARLQRRMANETISNYRAAGQHTFSLDVKMGL